MNSPSDRHPRIRSFVRRDSRLTGAQHQALVREWPRYQLPEIDGADDLLAAYSRTGPLTLEIGSGDGECLLQLAARSRAENFLAAEVYRPGLGRLVRGASKAGLTNVLAIDTDVVDLLVRINAPVFDRILIFFPDPWPKKRHHKRRLLQSEFFDLAAQTVQRHARVFIATDCASYAESVLEEIEISPHWINLAGAKRTAPRVKFRPQTKFERKAVAAGSRVFDIILGRR